MTNQSPPEPDMAETTQVDKNSVEYKIILELEEYCVLRCLTYTDFHGQEPGEDHEFDKLVSRERKARKSLLTKIGSLLASARKSGYQQAVDDMKAGLPMRAILSLDVTSNGYGYYKGWNACLAAMEEVLGKMGKDGA